MLCFIFSMIAAAQATYFDKSNQGIVNISAVIIPDDTVVCDFTENNIKTIPSNYFIGLSHLKDLWLSENEIYDIQPFAFYNVPTLKKLFLEKNKLEIVTSQMFAGLRKMEVLKLGKNFVHTVQLGSFANLKALRILSLAYNKLITLEMVVFEPKNYQSTVELRLHGNPLHCTRCLCWMMGSGAWMKLRYQRKTRCNEPSRLAGRPWKSLCKLELGCPMHGKRAI